MPCFQLQMSDKDQVQALENTKYLNLANVETQKSGNDVRFPNSTLIFSDARPGLAMVGRFIIIGRGQVKVIDRQRLKKGGYDGQFVLFPNLPLELRSKICQFTLPNRLIRAIEVFNDDRSASNYVILGMPRPMICRVSKEILEDMKASVYQPLFQTQDCGRKVYFGKSVDFLEVDSPLYRTSDKQAPKLALREALVNKTDLRFVQTVVLNLMAFNPFLKWGQRNILEMTSLKELHITSFTTDPLARQPTANRMSFKAMKDKSEYFAIQEQGDTSAVGEEVVDSFCEGVHVPRIKRVFKDLQNVLEECFKQEGYHFPEIVQVLHCQYPDPEGPALDWW